MAQQLETLAEEMAGEVRVVKVDTEEETDLATGLEVCPSSRRHVFSLLPVFM